MSKYNKLSKDELIKLIEKQEQELKTKKYGLSWDSEREPEQVVLDCENNLPVLERVADKEIVTNDGEDNILIEGDNYHALTVLNYTHHEKIDVIYIDPPYNTGNKDFVYNDRYVDREDGYRHSKWLNFMEKRLNLAHNLLNETGVIFISIDDNEVAQLKLLCDKIFSEQNFIVNAIWNSRKSVSSDTIISLNHNHTLIYAKNIQLLREIVKRGEKFKLLTQEEKFTNPDNDPRGPWTADPFDAPEIRENLTYSILNPNTGEYYLPPKGRHWRTEKEKYEALFADNRIIFGKTGKSKPQLKRYLSEAEKKGITAKSIWDDVGTTTNGTQELENILGEKKFNNPKPVSLIKKILLLASSKDGIVLDFFAGSGTTGHAVLELNKEDGGSRKFILCTNNEGNIATDVCYPRIQKVMAGYSKGDDGEAVNGLGGNLQYFRASLIKKANNRDQVKIDLTQKCTEMLCVKENIFNIELEKEDYKIFSSHKKNKFLCIYYNFIDSNFDNFLAGIKKLSGQKIVYMFSLENKVDNSLFKGIKDVQIETIPQKILDVYKQLAKLNIPIQKDTIFADFNKANDKIFVNNDKDDGARLLRVVIEKVLQKIAQQNDIQILDNKSKELKASNLNDELKNKNIFNKILWEENKTYIAIGNDAAHGNYNDYDIEQVKNFYKHVQNLINKFNI